MTPPDDMQEEPGAESQATAAGQTAGTPAPTAPPA